MAFREGKVAKHDVPKRYHRFLPIETVGSILAVSPESLIVAGKKLVLLDADNTLLPWRAEELPAETKKWIADARAAGLQLCLVSNTRNKPRLERLSATIGIPFAVGKFKPSREMYDHALTKFEVTPEQAIMIGDQIFTDVLGANRAGVDAILVRQIDRNEFIGTRLVSRVGEKWIWRKLAQAMESEVDDLPIVEPTGIFHKRIVRQLAKFCIVGLSSFAIDYNIRMTLQFKSTWGEAPLSEATGNWMLAHLPGLNSLQITASDAFFPVAAGCGAALAIVNSFIWNRLWTFSIRGKEDAADQFKKFVIIAVSGLVLNVIFSSIFNHLIPGDAKTSARIATILTAGLVAIWNFLGQRLYAFRARTT